MARLDLSRDIGDEELTELIHDVLQEEVQENYIPLQEQIALSRQLYHSFRKLDILQELIEDDSITEIMINGTEDIFLERNGSVFKSEKRFLSQSKLEDVIQQIVAGTNRYVNELSPIVDARLEDGSRVNVVLKPVALNGPIMTIRKFPKEKVTIEQLIEWKSISAEAAAFLEMLVRAKYNILVSGGTGAGKTTITNLINRFYEINSGKITYDGIDVKDIKKADLRKSLGVVLQDTHLFTGTIADNIRYGNLDATDEEVIAAAKLANAHSFIKHLPHGYDTVLTGDGEGLSQGQRQLLNIARAAVANPPVLIMDEATSSIDTRTEKLIAEGMDKLMEGRTVFVIAHRLSTIKNSEAIMVLEQGQIIERGNHDELLEIGGRYYQLYTGKAQLDAEEAI